MLFGSESFCKGQINVSSKYEKSFWSGVCAGVTVSMIDCPVELVKTQLQGQGMGRGKQLSDKGMFSMAKFIHQNAGFRGLYQVMTAQKQWLNWFRDSFSRFGETYLHMECSSWSMPI